MTPESRAGLGSRKPRRPHPASPDAAERRLPSSRSVDSAGDEGLVMLCVRVAPSLRRRLKLVAVQSGRPIQALATEALEAVCRQNDM
jgi:hypothetical protein